MSLRSLKTVLTGLLLLGCVSLAHAEVIITGVVDGPLSGGTPKAIEVYVASDVPDLSIYGLESANNGAAASGPEFTFPAIPATAGQFLYVATEDANFNAFFGFFPNFISGVASINGDDTIVLYENAAIVDVFGEIGVDGTGEPWDHLDGWAYRVDNTGPDGSVFALGNWTFSGPNALDGEVSNATAAVSFPIGSYSGGVGGTDPTVSNTSPFNGESDVAVGSNIEITFSEAVNVAAGWFEINCTVSGAVGAVESGGPSVFTLDPVTDLQPAETCTVTVFAANVTAQDDGANLVSDFVFSFTTAVLSQNLTIMQIQGAGHISPFEGQEVTTSGVVTAVVDGGSTSSQGFFIQDTAGDGDIATSDGIFVRTGGAPFPNVGDLVEVTGTVDELRFGSNLGTTRIEMTNFSVIGAAPLPTPVLIGLGGRVLPTEQIHGNDTPPSVNIETDPGVVFDPVNNGIDFYESLEGMLVQVNNPVVVGNQVFGSGSPGSREVYTLPDNGAGAGVGIRSPRGGIVIRENDFNPERVILNNRILELPGIDGDPIKVGDSYAGTVIGPIGYDFGKFLVFVSEPLPPLVDGGLTQEISTISSTPVGLTIATMNVENFSPADAGRADDLADQIVNHLNSPDIIGIQEVQDNTGFTDDGVTAADQSFNLLINSVVNAGGPLYEFRQIDPLNNQDGGAPGGNIRVGYLFNPARVSFIDRPGGDAIAANQVLPGPELQFSPGRVDPAAFFDSRKPLAAEFEFNGYTLFVIVVHHNSKGGDDSLYGANQPPILGSEPERLTQVNAVADLVLDILAEDPNALIVDLGDLNDFQFSAPLAVMEAAGLTNLHFQLPEDERYTFSFQGNSQVLDHILVSDTLFGALAGVDVVHTNSEFSPQATDHDPILARFTLARKGDANQDGAIDRNDLIDIVQNRNQLASGPLDPRDVDGNGFITIRDVRKAVPLCDNSACAPVNN